MPRFETTTTVMYSIVKQLQKKGSDWKNLKERHRIQTENRDKFVEGLRKRGIETKLVDRFDYTHDVISWADVVFAAGGDGTYLMAAAKITDCNQPLIGINTDPTRSVGHLCIPSKYTTDMDTAIEKMLSGDFKWKHRQRIRVTIISDEDVEEPLSIHNQMLGKAQPELRFLELDEGCGRSRTNSCDTTTGRSPETNGPHPSSRRQTIPVRALNEVFIGESLSSRVTYCELGFNGDPSFKIKSSGITICTGTGSTSWSFNINKLTPSCVQSLVRIIQDETGVPVPDDPDLVKKVTDRFNNSLIFDPSEARMAYTIRDPIVFRTGYDGNPRGFADLISIKSRMFEASIVLDGGLSYKFNDGAQAIFEILKEDALKTIEMD
jgi:NAD+ kinase